MHAFAPVIAPCQAALPNEVHIDELGNIYPHCSFYSADPSYSVGNLLAGDGGADAWLSALGDRARELCFPDDQPRCLSCKFLPCCLGGCPVHRIENGEPECPSALFDPDAYAIARVHAQE
jgi:radical SAM protein with 4Fe4S-binding SPASM domain